jgi:serine/threonine protein kinase
MILGRQPAIVHGDLHAVSHPYLSNSLLPSHVQANVLIDSNGIPCLCDFGLSRIMEETYQTTAGSGRSLRWKSPELIGEGEPRETVHSDIYAFGMTCIVRPLLLVSESDELWIRYRKYIRGKFPFILTDVISRC